MNLLAASAVALSSLAINAMPADASATEGTIHFNGQIVLSTLAPDQSAAAANESDQPQHSMARQSLPLKADFELLDYYADYMQDRGVAQTQLTLQTSAYE